MMPQYPKHCIADHRYSDDCQRRKSATQPDEIDRLIEDGVID